VLPAGAGWTTSRNWKPQWISRGRYDWRAWNAPPCSELPSNTATISAPIACAQTSRACHRLLPPCSFSAACKQILSDFWYFRSTYSVAFMLQLQGHHAFF